MKYRVHLYAVVRVPVDDIEADSQLEAVEKAENGVNLHHELDHYGNEWAEEIVYAMVDEEGDEEYDNSRWYDNTSEGWRREPGQPGHTR